MDEKAFGETIETPVVNIIHPERSTGRETIKYQERFHLLQLQPSGTIASGLVRESLLCCKPQKLWFESLYLECEGSINKEFSYQMGTILIS